MTIGIVGAGAFGTALGVALAMNGTSVQLWARDPKAAQVIQDTRLNPKLPDIVIPENITCSSVLAPLFDCDVILLAIPAQTLPAFLTAHADQLTGKSMVACCKGIDLTRMTGPASTIGALVPKAIPAMLTGPSFAADIARGLPTALTLACADDVRGAELQMLLSTSGLRLYRTTDIIGAELGGALKNVMAIASGVAAGAQLGQSAQAALITRGFPEMQRLAIALGAQPETLQGLSGFGDLVLTCTSDQSRNFRYGFALGRGEGFDAGTTVEGAATALAVRQLAGKLGLDMPVCTVVADLTTGKTDVNSALNALLSRPLKEE